MNATTHEAATTAAPTSPFMHWTKPERGSAV
jgi:hypothetical protein